MNINLTYDSPWGFPVYVAIVIALGVCWSILKRFVIWTYEEKKRKDRIKRIRENEWRQRK